MFDSIVDAFKRVWTAGKDTAKEDYLSRLRHSRKHLTAVVHFGDQPHLSVEEICALLKQEEALIQSEPSDAWTVEQETYARLYQAMLRVARANGYDSLTHAIAEANKGRIEAAEWRQLAREYAIHYGNAKGTIDLLMDEKKKWESSNE